MLNEVYDTTESEEKVSAVFKGITFTCGYLNDYPFEIPLSKLLFYVGSRGVVVQFICICGRTHETTIN